MAQQHCWCGTWYPGHPFSPGFMSCPKLPVPKQSEWSDVDTEAFWAIVDTEA